MSELLFFAIPFFIGTMILEFLLLRHEQQEGKVIGYEGKDSAASISMGLGYLALASVAKFATLPIYYWLYQNRIFDLEGFWWAIPLLFLGEDLCYYWYHRAGHEVRFFWASHVNHHSSQHYNLSTALRQSWTTPFTGWIFWAPLPLLGFPVEWMITASAISLLYQYWIHTEKIPKLGVFGLIFNTPSHHRVHHGKDIKYLDRNYAGILIIWDRLFGTFQAEEEDPHYGLLHDIDTFNPVKIAFHEWADMLRDAWNARTLRGKLGTLFMPPGWKEDGSGETVATLQSALSGKQSPPDPQGPAAAPASP